MAVLAESSALPLQSAPVAASEPRRVSLLHYAPILVLLLAVVADTGQLTDPDLWGHVRFGQLTLQHHGPLLTDPYSYSAPGQPWRNHEWLTEVVMALFYNHLGVFGLKLWKLGCVAATIFFIALAMAETGATATVQLSILTVASVALMPQMQFRPQLFTFLFFAALLAILARHNYRRRAPLWLAIPIMAVWGNLHGGYVIGIATLATYAGIVGIEDLIGGQGTARGLRLGLLAVIGTLATLLSPYGIDNWLVVLHAMFVHTTHAVINDWKPLIHAMIGQWHLSHFGVFYYLCVIGLMAAFAISVAMRPAGGDVPFVVLAAMMSLAAFAAARNMPLAVIACTLPAARHVTLLFADLRRRHPMRAGSQPPPERSAVNGWLAGAVGLSLAAYTGLLSTHLATETEYPSGAIAFMKAHALAGNVLVDFNWGQYFIWHAPESKVFIDGRNDSVYASAILNQYLAFYFGQPDALRVLQSFRHDFVLIPPKSKAVEAIRSAPGWRLIYQDDDAMLFAHANPFSAPLRGITATGAVLPVQYFP